MKAKKILIAALSFGLIFGSPSTVSFAAIDQVTQEERDEFNRRRNYQEIELLKTRANESKKILDEKKTEYSLLEESLKAKQELLEKLTLENQGKNDNVNDDLDSKISQLGYDIEVLQKSLEHKEKQIEYLEKEYFRIDRLQQDYSHTTKVNPFLLDKADAKYEIRGYGAKGIIDPNEQNNYVSAAGETTNKEELDKLLAEVREEVSKRTEQNSENPKQSDANKDEQTTPKEGLDEEIDSKEKPSEIPDENNEKPKKDTKSPDPNQQIPPSDELAEKEKSTDLKDKQSNSDENSEDTNENQSKPQTEENTYSKETPAKDLPATKVIDKQP